MASPKKPSKKGGASKGGAAKAAAKPAAQEKAPVVAEPMVAAAAPPPKAEMLDQAPAPSPTKKVRTFRRKLVGRVTSNKMAKTVIVEVVRSTLNAMYKKYVRSRERYKAHDEQNQYKVGDRVEIQEHRPISREKRWLVTRLISRPVEE